MMHTAPFAVLPGSANPLDARVTECAIAYFHLEQDEATYVRDHWLGCQRLLEGREGVTTKGTFPHSCSFA
jgi:hypothetical protein